MSLHSPRRAVPRVLIVVGDPPAVTRIKIRPRSSLSSDWLSVQRYSLEGRLDGGSE